MRSSFFFVPLFPVTASPHRLQRVVLTVVLSSSAGGGFTMEDGGVCVCVDPIRSTAAGFILGRTDFSRQQYKRQRSAYPPALPLPSFKERESLCVYREDVLFAA